MAGFEVTRPQLDAKAAEAVVAVREAFQKVQTLFEFLGNLPSDTPGGDPLTLSTVPEDPMAPNSASGKYGYTADEAYLLRYVFTTLNAIDIEPVLHTGRKLTGLE